MKMMKYTIHIKSCIRDYQKVLHQKGESIAWLNTAVWVHLWVSEWGNKLKSYTFLPVGSFPLCPGGRETQSQTILGRKKNWGINSWLFQVCCGPAGCQRRTGQKLHKLLPLLQLLFGCTLAQCWSQRPNSPTRRHSLCVALSSSVHFYHHPLPKSVIKLTNQ